MMAVTGPAGSTAQRSGHALWPVFGGIAALVVVVDQATKAWVDASFALASPGAAAGSAGAPSPVLGDLVRIAKVYNDGGIFGLAGDSAPVLAVASLGVIAVIVAVQVRQGRGDLLLSAALGLLLGGAIGNLLDRLRWGHVVDFVDMGIGTLRWYTWNIADAAISIAIVLLLAHGVLGDRLTRRRGGSPPVTGVSSPSGDADGVR